MGKYYQNLVMVQL